MVLVGCSSSSPEIPELEREQVESDVVPARAADGLSFDASTSRLVGEADGVHIYVARGDDGGASTGRQDFCIIAVQDDRTVSGCGARLPVEVGAFGARFLLVGESGVAFEEGEVLGKSVVVLD